MLGHVLGVETSGGASLATGRAGDHRPQVGYCKRQVEGYSVPVLPGKADDKVLGDERGVLLVLCVGPDGGECLHDGVGLGNGLV